MKKKVNMLLMIIFLVAVSSLVSATVYQVTVTVNDVKIPNAAAVMFPTSGGGQGKDEEFIFYDPTPQVYFTNAASAPIDTYMSSLQTGQIYVFTFDCASTCNMKINATALTPCATNVCNLAGNCATSSTYCLNMQRKDSGWTYYFKVTSAVPVWDFGTV